MKKIINLFSQKECKEAFQTLKERLMTALVVMTLDRSKRDQIYNDDLREWFELCGNIRQESYSISIKSVEATQN